MARSYVSVSVEIESDNKQIVQLENGNIVTVNLSEMRRFMGEYSLAEIVQMGFDIDFHVKALPSETSLDEVDFKLACKAIEFYRRHTAVVDQLSKELNNA